MASIQLKLHHKQQIASHGETTYPHECCGILLGSVDERNRVVSELHPVKNANAESPQNRYLIPPDEVLRAERYAREQNLEILGYYHSHPDVAAEPSEHDREHAWPWYSYLILSVQSGVAAELKAWELKPNRSKFTNERLIIVGEEQNINAQGGP